MTIREYLNNLNLDTRSSILLELYEDIKDSKSVPNLEKLKSIDKELDELFFNVVDKCVLLNNLIETARMRRSSLSFS